jgi:hypothetical protein
VMGAGSSSSSNEGNEGSEGSSDADFMPSCAFTGARPGYVYKRGSCGLGYYRDTPPPCAATAAAAAAAASGSGPYMAGISQQGEQTELDLSNCKELLQQLAALSTGNRCVALGTVTTAASLGTACYACASAWI